MEDREDGKIQYRLYAYPVNAKTVEAAQKQRFCRITPFYLLVYTQHGETAENAAEINGEDVERLSSADRDWLLGCNMELLAEDAKRREKEISHSLSEKIAALEQALEQAKNKSEG